MKNLDLLPLDEIQKQRVKKFAEMHQRYGGIVIDFIAGNDISRQYLFRVKDKKGGLGFEALIEKAQEVFKDEVPEHWKLYFTVMPEEDSKYYLTWDRKYVIRVHKYFSVWEIKVLNSLANIFLLSSTLPTVYVGPIPHGNTAEDQAKKWLKNYLITHNERL